MEKTRPGVGVVVVKGNQVLMGKRLGKFAKGFWSFSGGNLEEGETIEDCAKRELFEETGLIAKTLLIGPWETSAEIDGKHYLSRFVFVTEFEGVLQNKEPHKCEGWLWFDWEHLPEPLFGCSKTLFDVMDLKKLKALSSKRNLI